DRAPRRRRSRPRCRWPVSPRCSGSRRRDDAELLRRRRPSRQGSRSRWPPGDGPQCAREANRRDRDVTWEPSPVAVERAAFRAGRRRRSFAVAALSTLVLVAAAVLVVVTSPGWERTRDAFLDVDRGLEVLPALLEGLWLNLRVWVVTD